MGFKNWIDEDRPVMTAIDWKARAEAAEAERDELDAEETALLELKSFQEAQIEFMEMELVVCRAELAALKAANEWRPVTDGRL